MIIGLPSVFSTPELVTRPAQELPGTECKAAESQLLKDYMSLRRMVGWIGTLLPATLIAGNTIFARTLPDSMSDYYYTPMRNILIAGLSALRSTASRSCLSSRH
jgi:hypothetical protein